MFDGVPADHLYHFIASSSSPVPASSIPLHFPLLHSPPGPHHVFDVDPVPFSPVLQMPQHQHPNGHLLPQLHHAEDKQTSFQLQSVRSAVSSEQLRPWSHDEVLALLRIRSAMESWFPDFTWEQVSRKLAELGFKRSAETCKEKFAEESRHFSNMAGYSKSYRFLSELEELCHGENVNPHDVLPEKVQNNAEKCKFVPAEEVDQEAAHVSAEGYSRNEVENERKQKDRKRKRRRRKFERLKGFCEEIVNKMMTRQEELHRKVIEEMMKRDGEEIAREEAQKKLEIERMNKEIEIRAQEQAMAGDRQIKLVEFLNKLLIGSHSNSDVDQISENLVNLSSASFSSTSSSLIQPQNPNLTSTALTAGQNPNNLHANVQSTSSSEECLNPSPAIVGNRQETVLTPSSSSPNIDQNNLDSAVNERSEGNGKRWPREEVLALINIRCSLVSGNGGDQEPKEEAKAGGRGGGPPLSLWERISQKMMEMGYKRSAKRCKEKWENMNKYFRKTKDVSKKRSPGSRTCPYFHQLSSLYSQAKPLDSPKNRPPENHLE